MVIDPVCGMTVNQGAAAASVAHGGRTYYFCSQRCFSKFRANPAQFANAPAAGAAAHLHSMASPGATPAKAAKDLAKDPTCGMMVNKAGAEKAPDAGTGGK